MAGRILDVTAGTTLQHVRAQVRGHDWRDEGVGVVDVTGGAGGDRRLGAGGFDSDGSDAETVRLAFEVDPRALEGVSRHADALELTRDQALTLADELRAVADEMEAAGASTPPDGSTGAE